MILQVISVKHIDLLLSVNIMSSTGLNFNKLKLGRLEYEDVRRTDQTINLVWKV